MPSTTFEYELNSFRAKMKKKEEMLNSYGSRQISD